VQPSTSYSLRSYIILLVKSNMNDYIFQNLILDRLLSNRTYSVPTILQNLLKDLLYIFHDHSCGVFVGDRCKYTTLILLNVSALYCYGMSNIKNRLLHSRIMQVTQVQYIAQINTWPIHSHTCHTSKKTPLLLSA